VIVSFPYASGSATGGIITTNGANEIHTFLSNGTFTISGGSSATIQTNTLNFMSGLAADCTVTGSCAWTVLAPADTNKTYQAWLTVVHDATTNAYTMSFGHNVGNPPTLTQSANAKDVLPFISSGTNWIYAGKEMLNVVFP
jgi:hypothetical protein